MECPLVMEMPGSKGPPHWKKYLAALRPTSRSLSVLRACVHTTRTRGTHTVHHFSEGRLYIYIYVYVYVRTYIYTYDVLIQWLPFLCRKKKEKEKDSMSEKFYGR